MGGEAGSDAGERKGTLGRVWFWVSQTVSVIGLISIVDDLQLWLDAARWAIEKLDGVLPALADLAIAIGNAIHPVLEIFRGLFRPIVDFLLQWLPFPVPELAKDVVVVAIFVALGHFRTRFHYSRKWSQANEADKDELFSLAQQAGIRCERGRINEVKYALSAYRTVRSSPKIPSLHQYIARYHDQWNAALERYGPELEAFAARYADNPAWHTSRTGMVYRNEERAMYFVWSLGLLVGLLVLIDVFFIR